MNSNVEWRLTRLWYGCGIALLLLVAVISLVPVSDSGGNDKLAHVLIYLVLSSWFSLIAARPALLWRVFFGLIAYGMLMELLQGLTDYRSLEFADALANSVGVTIGLLFHFSPFRRLLMVIDSRLDRLRH
jgi:VanZ family protein